MFLLWNWAQIQRKVPLFCSQNAWSPTRLRSHQCLHYLRYIDLSIFFVKTILLSLVLDFRWIHLVFIPLEFLHLNIAIYINVSDFKMHASVCRQLALPHRTIYPSVHLQLQPRTDSCSLLLKRYRLINKDRSLYRKKVKQHPLTTIPSPYNQSSNIKEFLNENLLLHTVYHLFCAF